MPLETAGKFNRGGNHLLQEPLNKWEDSRGVRKKETGRYPRSSQPIPALEKPNVEHEDSERGIWNTDVRTER